MQATLQSGAYWNSIARADGGPLGFWSKHLKPDKARWTTFRRELYAIQQAMRHFHTQTEGRHVTVYTDHKPILGAFKSPNGQAYDPIAANHLAEISQFTTDIRYIDGKANVVADWLSRPPGVPLGKSYTVQKEDPDSEPIP